LRYTDQRTHEMASPDCFRLVGLLGLGCLTLALGCGESGKKQDASVQGAVTIDGELAKRGTIAFHPVGKGPAAYGSINENGTFSLRIGQGYPGDPDRSLIYPGDYVASVVVRAPSTSNKELGDRVPPKPGVLLSAAKYSNKATSGLKYTIKSGTNVVDVPIEAAVSEEELDTEVAESTEEQQPSPKGSESAEAETPLEAGASEEPNKADTPAEESDQ